MSLPRLLSQLRDIQYIGMFLEPYVSSKTAVLLHLSSTLPHGKPVSEFPEACALFWKRCTILEKGKQVSGRMNLLCALKHCVPSPLPSPPSSVSSEVLPHFGYSQPVRRTPGGWRFTNHDDLHFRAPSEQNDTSLPCSAALQRAALKSKIMGENPHAPRPFSPCLNETGYQWLAKSLLQLQAGSRNRRGLAEMSWAVQREQLVSTGRSTAQRTAFPAEAAEQAKRSVPGLDLSVLCVVWWLFLVHGITISADCWDVIHLW